jgi:hypothetical protein
MEAKSTQGGTFRKLILVLILLTAIGLIVELALLGHTEDRVQWIPFATLGFGALSAAVFALWPSPQSLRVLRWVMAGCLAAGLAGLYFHYKGNVEFELEMYPSRAGFELFWEAMTGATPALAPGALAQLGLLGLAFTYRHPARGSARTKPAPNGE